MNKEKIMSKKMINRINRRAQLEIFGLIVLVIIVIVGFLVFMVANLNKSHTNIKHAYMTKELATNTLLALSKTNVREDECYGHSLAQLIIDCSKTYHSFSCYGRSSCEVLNSTIEYILSEVLEKEGIRYNFTIHDTGISFVNDCFYYSKDKVQSFLILPTFPGQLEITLDICN